MKSIVQDDKCCYVCGTEYDLHVHHICYGAYKGLSDVYGVTCYLCGKHHNMSNYGVHFNRGLDLELKALAEKKFDEKHKDNKRCTFKKVFGKTWTPEYLEWQEEHYGMTGKEDVIRKELI